MIEKIIEKFEELARASSSAQTEAIIGMQGALANFYNGEKSAYEKAIEIVQEVAKNGGWIPCEVELPPEPKENPVFDNKPLELYLVTLQGTEYPFRAFWTGKEFTDGWGKLRYVTAWQPLPPKYEPKDTPYQKGE